jgi:hypothetical protein
MALREHSFASKLATLAPGETIIVPEEFESTDRKKPTKVERAVQTEMTRGHLKGRRFVTRG